MTTFAKSDFIKGALDGFISLSNIIEKIVSSDIGSFALGFAGLATIFSKLTSVFGKGSTLGKLLDIGDATADIIEATKAGDKLSGTFTGIGKIIKGSLGIFGTFNSTLITGLAGLLAAVVAYDKYQQKAREERMEESRENIKNLESEIKTEKQKLDGIRNVVEEYDQLRSKSKLTAEEQERYLELTRQIAQVFPELVSGYDENGDPILKLNGSLETYMGNLDRAIEKQERLLKSEENKLAEEWENKRKELNLKENNTRIDNSQYDTNARMYDQNGEFDVELFIDELEKTKEAEERWYNDRLEYTEEKEKAISEVREKYRNDMQEDTYYKNASEKDQQEIEETLDGLDLYSMGEENAEEFTRGLARQREEIVSTTEEMGDYKDEINKLEEDYINGKIILDEYTKGISGIYKEAKKMDNESLFNWLAEVEEYGEITGDLEGVKRQIKGISEALEETTGIDADLWEKALTPNIEPIEQAKKRLNEFLNLYNTGAEHLGKGGLADKLEREYQSMNEFTELSAKEFSEKGYLTKEFVLEYTFDSPTPIKKAMELFLQDDGKVDEEEYELYLRIQTDIVNKGEITPETEELLREYLPDEIEDEVIASLKVKTDVQAKKEIDDLLKKRDELNSDVEFEIYMRTDSAEEAENLYNVIMKLPEEKRLNAVSNYGKVKEEAYQAGISIENIPPEKIVNITANMDNKQIEMFISTLKQVDGEQFLLFLQTEGAEEALAKCESVQQMIDLITGKKTVAEIEVENKQAEEKTEATKQSLESTEGTYRADLMVHTDKGDLDLVEGQIYEMDGKTYIAVFNVDTNKVELVETEEKINTLDGKKAKAEIDVEADTENAENVEETISNIPEETNVVVKAQTEVENLQETLNNLQGQRVTIQLLIDSSNAMMKIANVTSGLTSMTDKTINLLINSSNAMSKITNVQNGLASISDKTVQILADSSNAMLKINNVKSGLTSIPDETVKILADSSNAMLKIANVKAGLESIPKTTTVKILGDSSNAMLKINRVKEALATLSSKTVYLNVVKTETVKEASVERSIPTAVSATPAMLSNTPLANIPVSASSPVSTSESSSLANVPVTAKASSNNILDISKILPSLDFDISHIKNLEEALERLGGQLDLLNEKSEATFGQAKISLLKQQIPLLREQQKIQEQIAINERNQNNELIYWLNNKGFSFDAMGNISNYNDKLLEMEKNVESLKKKSEASSDNKSLKEQYDAANEALEKTKDYLEEYFTTNNTEITEASKKWWEYENSIRETEQAIRDVINAQLENKIEAVVDQIDFLDAKIDNLSEQDKVTYLKQQNELYKEQQDLSHQLAEQMRSQLATLDENSDEYIELQKEINDLSTEWWELESAIADTNEALEEIKRNKAIEPLRNSLEEINYLLDRHSDRLDLIDAQYENATGAEKVEYLTKKQQILNEQLVAQEEAYKRIYNLASGLQNDLWQFGFKLDENSLISNYDEVLNSLYGTEEYELAKKYADEYMEIVREDLIDIQIETYETKNALKEMTKEMQEAVEEARQNKLESFKNSLEEVRYELDRVNDRLDLLDEKNQHTTGTGKLDYLQDRIGLLNEKLEISQREFEELYDLIESTQNDLWQYGFKVDANSLISNYDEVLNALAGTEQYENAKKVADEYMELMRDDYIENKLTILEIQNEIKDAYNEQLEATKEIEDEITDIIKKEAEKRKEEIEKYTEERISLLEKEKKAYQELREEQRYEESVDDKVAEITDLQKKLDTAMRDNTVSGLKRQAELEKEIAEAQKELEEITQEKIDDDFEENIDKEIEKIQEEEDKLLAILDEKFSDESIAKMVQQALTSGFVELNGKIISIQELLMESINDSAEGYSVMANTSLVVE